MFRRSPIPKGGLEIPMKLCVRKGEACEENFVKMKRFPHEYYLEHYNVPVNVSNMNKDEKEWKLTNTLFLYPDTRDNKFGRQ